MPIREYLCKKCNKIFEEIVKMSDTDPKPCPDCTEISEKIIISTSSFHLKGGGWGRSKIIKQDIRKMDKEQKLVAAVKGIEASTGMDIRTIAEGNN